MKLKLLILASILAFGFSQITYADTQPTTGIDAKQLASDHDTDMDDSDMGVDDTSNDADSDFGDTDDDA